MYKTEFEIKGVIEQYKKELQALSINAERIILYGSFARGTQREDSDIDLIVISEDFRAMNLRERLETLGVAAVRIRKPIEAKGYTLKEAKKAPKASFLKEVLKSGDTIPI